MVFKRYKFAALLHCLGLKTAILLTRFMVVCYCVKLQWSMDLQHEVELGDHPIPRCRVRIAYAELG